MDYEIVMPQLSDSMEEGKLISWKVKVDDQVNMGDVIAEVESDKAIMEVQSFKKGVIKALHLNEGESAPVGTVIVSIDTEGRGLAKEEKKDALKEVPKKELQIKEAPVKERVIKVKVEKEASLSHGAASPKAKILAAEYGLQIKTLQMRDHLPIPAHEKDIISYHQRKYFTPKALRLMDQHALPADLFDLCKKYDSQDVLEYIHLNDIPSKKPLDSFQKALIKTVESALQKPTYHIFEHIDARLLLKYSKHKMTAWLIKLFAQAMMEHEGFRSIITQEGIQVWPNASISVAMAKGRLLFMPVFKQANILSVQAIEEKILQYKRKLEEGSLTAEEMQDSSFGVSNLGMTGIERFDAIINQNDSAIAAIGSDIEGKIAVTLTIDHRLINGYEAALFMQSVKRLAVDEDFFKEE